MEQHALWAKPVAISIEMQLDHDDQWLLFVNHRNLGESWTGRNGRTYSNMTRGEMVDVLNAEVWRILNQQP